MNKYLLLVLGILLTIPATLSLSAAETDIQWPIGEKTYELSMGAQVKTEAALQDGGFYVIHQPRNNCCIEEGADHKLMLNGLAYTALNGTTNTSYVVRLLKNADGTWRIQTASGRYFPVPTGNQNLYSAEEAGNYTMNFNAEGYIFPRIEAGGVTYGVDRASYGAYAYTTLNNTVGSAQCYQIYAVSLAEPGTNTNEIAEFTAYQIVNANGRGKLYYSPDNSSEFVWSTGKNETNTSEENYQWVFVKANGGSYYLYNVGRRAFIEPTAQMGNFSGQTWVFTQNKTSVTITPISGSNNFTIRTTQGNVYMSVSNSYNGPIISYYAEGDGGVPFYFVKGSAVSDEVKDNILNGNHSLLPRDISVKQGYQTVGRNSTKALLLRINIPGNIENATIDKISVALKGNTLKNISQLQVYQTNNQEFYADDAPRKIGEVKPTTENVEIPIANYTLRSGSNLLWLTAAINTDATLADFVDARLTQIAYTHEGESQTLDIPQNIGDPNGQAQIFNVQSLAYVPTTDNCQYYRIPAMIVDQQGNIVIAADRRYGSNADLGNHKIDVSVRRSLDGGRTWSKQNIIAIGDGKTTADFGYGDPALARTPSGRLICVMAAGSTMYWNGMRNAAICMSDDNGVTWTQPRQLYESHFTDAVNGKTNAFGFYGNFVSSGKGLTTRDGVVMFTNNCLTYENKNTPQCYILWSADNGENWTIGPANAYAGCDESKLEQLNNGDLMVSVRQSGARGFNTGSADATKWDTQWRNDQISGNACNADILYYSRSTEGKRDIIIHSYIKSSARENLTLAMSIDQGATWHDFMNIQPGGSCYSTMQRLNDGSLAVLYEDESYSVGNGYAINFVTVTEEQINAFADQLKQETSEEYQKALDQLENGGVYYFATNYLDDQPFRGFFYLKADGTLTTDISLATYFTFQRKAISNGFKPIGWKSGLFTNPTNANTNTPYIRTDKQNRDTWEAQVITCNADGLYAIRATNAPTETTWGSNAYWTTDADGHATYDLKGAPHYIWRIIRAGATPRFDASTTYRIISHLQGGYAMESENCFLTYYGGIDDFADDFIFQAVPNETGAFTIRNKRTGNYVSQTDSKGYWSFGETAAQFRIQQIDNDDKESIFIIQAPFDYKFANLTVDCLVNPDTQLGGNFRILNYDHYGSNAYWEIMTTEEAMLTDIQLPSSNTHHPTPITQHPASIFSIDGARRAHLQQGLNIIQQGQAPAKKVIVK